MAISRLLVVSIRGQCEGSLVRRVTGPNLRLGLGSVLIEGVTSTFQTPAKFILQWLSQTPKPAEMQRDFSDQ